MYDDETLKVISCPLNFDKINVKRPVHRIEFQIARDKDKLSKHYDKREKLVETLA